MNELDKFYRGAVVEHRRKDWTPLYVLLGIAGMVTLMVIAIAIAVTVIAVAVAGTIAVVTLKGAVKK
jgi:hypothetical protein